MKKYLEKKNKIVDVGIRLNPNINPNTLKKITTGRKEDKFGLTDTGVFDIQTFNGQVNVGIGQGLSAGKRIIPIIDTQNKINSKSPR